ncbi:unnamed protein product, partial [Polarella glacialis]
SAHSQRPRFVGGGGGPSGSVEEAWAEAEHLRRTLEQREREIELREAAVRRAEVRNNAKTRQLSEMRRRLEDYSEELEEGVVALAAQQAALRDERRHATELQARARRMVAAATREDNLPSKMRNWE